MINSNEKTVGIIKKIPIFMGVLSNSNTKENDSYSDATFLISSESGMLYIKEIIPSNLLYQCQTTQAPIGNVWKEHHTEFSKFILNINNKNKILEVGAAHGYLAKITKNLKKDINWTIIEPNPVREIPEGIKYIKGYLTKDLLNQVEPECIVHSHVIEHINEINKFMSDISSFQSLGDKLIISIPHLNKWFSKGFPNALNFEHRFLIDAEYVEELHKKYGYKLIKFQDFKNDHSRFCAFEKVSMHTIKNYEYKSKNNREKDSSIYFNSFIKSIRKTIIEFSKYKSNFPDYKVAIFGASVLGQMLFPFGLSEDHISCILDNDKLKEKARLYGTNLRVENPQIIKNDKWIVIVKMGSHTTDVINQLKKINPKVKIVI